MEDIVKEAIQNTFFIGSKQAEKKLDIVLSLITDVFFEYDIVNDSILFNNKNANDKQKKEQKEFRNTLTVSNQIKEEDKKELFCFLNGEKAEAEYRFINEDGTEVWFVARGSMIYEEDGSPLTLIGCINNIDKQKRENDALHQQLRMDPLTHLNNKVYTQELITDYLTNEGSDGEHALMIIDIDNFKTVNDNLGHLFGDTVLSNISDKLQKLFYATDIVGRIGGDEFIILIKNIKDITVLREKTNCISGIFLEAYTGEIQANKISCSIGITLYPKDGSDYLTLFKNADKALYQAKRTGKNHCEFYEQGSWQWEIQDKGGYYNCYEVEETDYSKSNDFDKEITAFAFDIMSRTKDVSSAIQLLLGRVGKYFSADHVAILENSEDNLTMNLTYQWNLEQDSKVFEQHTIQYSKYPEYMNLFDQEGILYLKEIEQMDQLPIGRILGKIGMKSLLQCAMFENGKFSGCVSVDVCNHNIDWTKSEINSLFTISKIVSAYLLKMRTSEKIKARLDKINNYDDLTGLPTLHKFKKIVKTMIQEYPEDQHAIVYSDFSNFKYINDTFGYDAGNQILCDFAHYIKYCDFKNRGVGRISADNFVAILKYSDAQDLKCGIEKANEEFIRMQREKNINYNIIIISGVCLLNPKEDISVTIDNANTARKSVKDNLKTICAFYNVGMTEKIRKELEINNLMEESLGKEEFKVYLQPKINLSDGRLVGAEALSRWLRADGTIMPPDDFIPIFEKNGFIVNLDFYVYDKVCQMIRKWLDSGMKAVPVSVNVSRVHMNDEKFVEKIKNLVDFYHVPAELLELELTESIFLNNTEVALSIMHELRRLGFLVSIDDFGAGYSSLNLLKDMHTDVLKLDKEFFGKGEMQKEEQIIVSSIISMAKQLNMKVLSEGVETWMQSEFLKEISCDMAQGYLYAKPMPISEFEGMIANQYFPIKKI